MAQQYIAEGGIGYAKELLDKALGEDRAKEVIDKTYSVPAGYVHLNLFEKTDPSQLLNFIQDEHPQTIAMILSYLTSAQAATCDWSTSAGKTGRCCKTYCNDGSVPSPDVIKEVERVLEKKLSSLVNQDYTIVGGVDASRKHFKYGRPYEQKNILWSLWRSKNQSLADEIRKKMFVFEDILLLDDRAIQRVLRDVDNADLGVALKAANEEVQNVIFKNLSKRLAADDQRGYGVYGTCPYERC